MTSWATHSKRCFQHVKNTSFQTQHEFSSSKNASKKVSFSVCFLPSCSSLHLFQHEFLSLCLWASFHPQKRDIPIPTFHDFWRFFEVDNYLDVFWGVSGTKYFNKNWTNYIRFSSSIQSAYLPKIRQTCLFFCRKIDGNRKRKWHCWFSPPTFWPMVGKMMVEKYANVSPALVTFDMGWKSSKHVWGLGPHQEAAAFNGTNHDHHENFGKNSIWHPKQSCFGNIFNWFRLEFLSWLPNRLRSFPNKDDAMMLCAKKKLTNGISR